MTKEVLNFVDKIQSQLMYDLVDGESNLEQIAQRLMECHQMSTRDICQAYEVVKHELVGTL